MNSNLYVIIVDAALPQAARLASIFTVTSSRHFYQHLRQTKLDGCIVFNEHNTVFASKRAAIYNRWFLGPTPVLDANGISIALSVLAELTR